MNVTDNDIINAVLQGDHRAFKQLVDNNQKLVAHIIFRMTRQPDDVEDLCQDVFVKAYENLHRFRFQSKLSTWLAKIAFNTAANYLEKKRVPLYDDTTAGDLTMNDLSDYASSPEEQTLQSDIGARIRSEMARLAPIQRTILTLYHLDGLSYDEIGDITDLPQGTVKSYLFRARKHLKERLNKMYHEEEL